ncbi:MAG: hypothetical protein BWK77_02710 [Verrucomicrobia bacterium A1]|nr:MAG: hypothetical protein BWK77_02710 [Verrucomicrobia bacterium A1]
MHLPSINACVLFFASRWRLDGLPTYALLAGIAEDPDELETAPTGSLLIDALRLMAEIDPQRRAPGFRSAGRIRRFHEAIVREHREMLARREREKASEARRRIQRSLAEDRRLASQGRGPTDLPRPPVAGTETIVPLATAGDLDQESAQQSNCAATMAGDVRAGRYYLYRVLSPSRATVALAMGPDARWRVEQIRGPRNTEAPPETRRAVERWLDRAQRSL